jgi:hypothetical protein
MTKRTAILWDITQRRVVILYRRFGTTYRYHLQGSTLFLAFLTLKDGTDTLSRNVGKGLPLDAALFPRRAQFSSASRRKPEVTDMTKLIAGLSQMVCRCACGRYKIEHT